MPKAGCDYRFWRNTDVLFRWDPYEKRGLIDWTIIMDYAGIDNVSGNLGATDADVSKAVYGKQYKGYERGEQNPIIMK